MIGHGARRRRRQRRRLRAQTGKPQAGCALLALGMPAAVLLGGVELLRLLG
jgi:hypothetical protein